MMIVVIDNFDSFTFNIVEYYRNNNYEVQVFRNNEISISQLELLNPSLIILSPGPKDPSSAGITVDLIKYFSNKIPLFGICLGCQALAYAYGAKIIRAEKIFHGKTSLMTHQSQGVLHGVQSPMKQMRYHSLIIEECTLSSEFEVTARSEAGEIMAIKHRYFALEGVQFHPESIASVQGETILKNAMRMKQNPTQTSNTHTSIPVDVDKETLNKSSEEDIKFQQLEFANKLINGTHLSKEEAAILMTWLSDGLVHEQYIAMILTALRIKGETADELAGIAQVFQQRVVQLPLSKKLDNLVDIVGTGGDLTNTFNISTAAAIVVAGAGATVAKHGNRAVTSKSGSADVLEALGVDIELSPTIMAKMLEEVGMCFLYAPLYHPSMKHVAPVRKQLKIRTVFNILGPLVNPALVPNILLGVYSKDLMMLMAESLVALGISHALVVHAEIGSDEIALDGITYAIEIYKGNVHSITINPNDYFPQNKHSVMGLLEGGDANYNAKLIKDMFSNTIQDRALQNATENIVSLNAGAALYVSGKAKSIEAGITLAQNTIHSGAALKIISDMQSYNNKS